jgi:hypothetical protein
LDFQRAERDAHAYAAKASIAVKAVACMRKDSDGDGYCRCTLFGKDGARILLDCGCEVMCWPDCAQGCAEVFVIKGVEVNRRRRTGMSVEK